jgi:predicted metal-dependent phosphoesterase TrpH
MRIDLHCHTEASNDCSTPLERIPARARARGIQVLAITDHNEIWGAKQIAAQVAAEPLDAPSLTIILGEEVSTREGEIIGLFLNEKIPAQLTPEETVAAIHEQGGLALLPHGFDPLKRWRLQPAALARVADQIDLVEAFNARISRRRWNQAASDWGRLHGCPLTAGSDAHTLADIGSAWVETPDGVITGPQALLDALEGKEPGGIWTHPALAYVYKLWDRARTRLLHG